MYLIRTEESNVSKLYEMNKKYILPRSVLEAVNGSI